MKLLKTLLIAVLQVVVHRSITESLKSFRMLQIRAKLLTVTVTTNRCFIALVTKKPGRIRKRVPVFWLEDPRDNF
jgi:hypothetical protein